MIRKGPPQRYLRHDISHYDRAYGASPHVRVVCRACGAPDTAAVIAGMPLCAACAIAAMRLVDVRQPIERR